MRSWGPLDIEPFLRDQRTNPLPYSEGQLGCAEDPPAPSAA